jgi:uncharacterized membrane protein
MNKAVFLSELASKLEALPQTEVNKSLAFYSEIIDDRMEEGMDEEEAIGGLGNIEEIARDVMLDATPIVTLLLSLSPSVWRSLLRHVQQILVLTSKAILPHTNKKAIP